MEARQNQNQMTHARLTMDRSPGYRGSRFGARSVRVALIGAALIAMVALGGVKAHGQDSLRTSTLRSSLQGGSIPPDTVQTAGSSASIGAREEAPDAPDASREGPSAEPVHLIGRQDDDPTIETVNVRNADLRDVLRSIASRYDLNLVVDDRIDERVTIRLSDISVVEAVTFLCEEYGLVLERAGRVFRIDRPEPEPEPLAIEVEAGMLSVDLEGAPVREVARRLSQVGPANVVVGRGVSGAISGYLKDAGLEEGLAALLQNNGFELHEEGDIYTVVQPEEDGSGRRRTRRSMNVTVEEERIDLDVAGARIEHVIGDIARQMDLELITYDVPDGQITAHVEDLTLDEALSYLLKGTEVTYRKEGDRYIIAGKNVEGIASSRLIRLEHLKAETVAEMLPQSLQQDAALKVAKEQNGIIVTGSSAAIREIESFVREVDHPTPQILIEALVVDFNMDDLFDLGLRFGKGPAGSEPTVEGDAYLFDEGGYSLEASGEQVDEYIDAIGRTLQFVGHGLGESIRNVGRLPPEFFLGLDALSKEGKAEIKSRPQISTLNGHPANISVGTTQYFILQGTTSAPSGGGGYLPIQQERFEKIEANVTLDIVPWVTASGEVTVEIRPEFSMPVGQFSSQVPPTINTRVLESTVRLKDGETIILGGLIQESKTADYTKIPLLGGIPLLGQLFRSRRHKTNKSELVIYLTPHVFYGGEGEAGKWDRMREELGLSEPDGAFSIEIDPGNEE